MVRPWAFRSGGWAEGYGEMARFYGVAPNTGQHEDALSEDGPVFNFTAPEVVEAGDSVVSTITQLRNALRVERLSALHSQDVQEGEEISGVEPSIAETEAAYLACISILTAHMPGLYAAYDRYIEAVLATGEKPVSCRPSCPSCCAHYVTSVEPVELLFLDATLRGRADYADRLFDMHERTLAYSRVYDPSEGDEAEDKALHRYFLRGRPCPFLTAGGECGVREARPMSCRMFFSYSDPRYCAGRKIVSAANRNFHVGLPDEAESLLAEASTTLERLGLSEHLFDGLMRVNETLGRFGKPPIS
jgi:Fe-S-cluster containining protein